MHPVRVLGAVAALASLCSAAVPDTLRKRDICTHDNCYRAVFGSNAKSPTSLASRDCSSLLRSTVVPCPVTSTVSVQATTTVTSYTTTSTVTTYAGTTTTTVSVTSTLYQKKKRAPAPTCTSSTVSPSAVPTYASSCSGYARFSSICACQGISSSTVTASAQTVLTTTTSTSMSTIATLITTVNGGISTSTVTTSVVQTTTCSSFYAKATLPASGYLGGGSQLVSSPANAITFSSGGGYVVHVEPSGETYFLAENNQRLFLIDRGASTSTLYAINCQFSGPTPGRGPFTCYQGDATNFYTGCQSAASNGVFFTTAPPDAACVLFGFEAVPSC